MKLQELLTILGQHNVKVYLDQGSLKTQAAPGAITPELAGYIKLLKDDLVQLLHQSEQRQTEPLISRQPRTEPLLLSYGQERLWMIDQLQGGSTEYNMQFVLGVSGDFDLQIAERVFTTIVQRHEVLRTTYRSGEDGVPKQCIQLATEVPVQLIHLPKEQVSETDVWLAKLAAELAATAFDLRVDPMLKVVFVSTAAGRTDPTKHQGYLLLTMHHIAADGWSMAILHREFVSLYQAELQATPLNLVELPIQYADYAHWQRQMLARSDYQLQLDYWLQQLADIPPVHSLPLDKNRPPVKQYQGALVQTKLAGNTSTALLALARESGLTPFMMMHALFAVLLSRHSNQQDVVIGIPLTNRPKPELNGLVGFFINTLVLRLNMAQPTVGDLLAQVRRVHHETQANSDVPFEQLADLLQVPRTTAHTPVFQIMLTADTDYTPNLPDTDPMAALAVEFSAVGSGPVQAKFDLNLDFRLDADGINISWIYDVSLFSEIRIRQMSDHFCRLVQQLVSTPAVLTLPMERLQLLSEQEVHQQLKVWNQPSNGHRTDLLLHQLFLQQVDVAPEQTALIDQDGQMSYRQLFEAAALLCELLHEQSLNPGERVGVRMPKGRHQVIAVLAILMAGGVYLPMETNWPSQRCEKICQKAACRLNLIVEPDHQLQLPNGNNLNIKTVASQALLATQLPATATQSRYLRQQADTLAYVIFTSGSTGEPKGVEIEHHSVMNTLLEMIRYYQLNAQDRVLAVSALSFDLSVFDIFGMLAIGGAVVLPDARRATDPGHWLELVEQHQVTIWDTVPAAAGLLADQLEYLGRTCLAPVRHMLLSGDWIAPSLPARLWRLLPGCQVHSLGGATEAAIWSIHYPITSDPVEWRSVPYGRAMYGQSFYILDQRQQLLPAGVTGELYIGGRGVARGYCADEALTSRQFIWHQQLGIRLYRTGDLGRYMPDGLIEFIGRADHQVKIRGFRIELGEIEVVLNQQLHVDSSLVIASRQAGSDHLVAYVKLTSEGSSQAAEVLSAVKVELARQLPSYMVPSAFVLIDSWPLTANGKICKKSLPPATSSMLAVSLVAAKTDTEIELAGLWADLLAVPSAQLSAAAGFFESGGHSLLLIKLMVSLRRQFDVELKMQDLLTHQTIQQQAMLIESARYFSRLQQCQPKQSTETMVVTL
ncbi:hypothetical protein A5320_03910 [Rheinheimera sp. SA_1]|uniref:non-ribosomal peptide synthetase n=1 Tax=Rheinheimera sp. SA_1 TaxID=1827365 RepID=UPI000801EA80|nr:non-ribosomal peptide synthetase [Rheinheimera sp. SA_1]OBP16551.1 hypothetical protein A5320_03910 [Rheinheimera sp. SA_1]